jgi:glycosyltransferase involved in cell wall biosynthesis
MDAIITGCELSRRNLSEIQGNKKPVQVIAPLDRIDNLPIATDRKYGADSPLHLGMIARLGYGKGVATLIDIWPELNIGDAHLHFYGPDEKGLFASLVASRGLSDRIHVHGVFPREQLCDIAGKLDLGLMLSFEEGYGLAVWEYMASGLPFLMTKVGAFSEFTTSNPDGLSVSANKEAIKTGIRTMVARIRANKTSRIRLQEFHKCNFSYEKAAAQYVAYFIGGRHGEPDTA